MGQETRGRIALVASALAMATLLCGTPAIAAEEPNTGKVSFDAGMDFTSAYFFRGILQSKNGFIGQPWADVNFNLYEGSSGLTSAGATLGIWNSIQSVSPGTADPTAWYEFDFIAGLNFGLFDKFTADTVYTIYTSPNGSFGSTQEIAFGLSYDDSDLLGPFALSPHILVAFEIQGAGATGPDLGTYFQLDLEPSYTVFEGEKYPVTLSLPLTLGLSLGDYYENPNTGADSTFGYFDLGIKASVPLAFIPADYGSWEAYVKGDFFFLGNSTKAINAGDNFTGVVTAGVSMSY